MRRHVISVSILAIILLACCLAFANAETDFTVMTDNEIIENIRQGCNELALRSTEGKTVIFESNQQGIKITLDEILFRPTQITIKGTIINGSDADVQVKADKIYVNNWKCGKYGNVFISAEAGRNNRGDITETSGLKDDALISSFEDIQIVEVVYEIKIGKEAKYITVTYTPAEIRR